MVTSTPRPELRLEGPSAALLLALDALRTVKDGRLGDNIVDLGMVRSLCLDGQEAELQLVGTGASCPVSDLISAQALRALQRVLPDTDLYITHAQDMEWSPARASAQVREHLDALA